MIESLKHVHYKEFSIGCKNQKRNQLLRRHFQMEPTVETIYGEEIKQTYKMDDNKVEIFYIITSSLDLILQKTESYLFKLLGRKGKESRKQCNFFN
jgi:hypothetical protein